MNCSRVKYLNLVQLSLSVQNNDATSSAVRIQGSRVEVIDKTNTVSDLHAPGASNDPEMSCNESQVRIQGSQIEVVNKTNNVPDLQMPGTSSDPDLFCNESDIDNDSRDPDYEPKQGAEIDDDDLGDPAYDPE